MSKIQCIFTYLFSTSATRSSGFVLDWHFFRVVPFRTLHASVSRSVVEPALHSILSHQALLSSPFHRLHMWQTKLAISLCPTGACPYKWLATSQTKVEKTERQRMQETVAAHTVAANALPRESPKRRDKP